MNAISVKLSGSQDDYAGGDQIEVGPVLEGFLNEVAPSSSRESLRKNAIGILQECAVSSMSDGSRTGLVVGRVQSGKTLSYEAVIALARDNDFALVVILSGISNPLLDQGVTRLKADLTAADEDGWNFLINPSSDAQDVSTLRSLKENWADKTTPKSFRTTAVCFLLKHYGRIESFKELCARVGWSGQKVLIVDDEADQASLNAGYNRKRESSTYRAIRELRETFPHHAYLQYTATPQAPLLISISDVSSPDFVRVIEPGDGYKGGEAHFVESNEVVRTIPGTDLEMVEDSTGGPPPSLVLALQEFVLGSCDVLAKNAKSQRSMLVHPSRYTEPHALFSRWIKGIVQSWRFAIEDELNSEDSESLKLSFMPAWDSLRKTDATITDFDGCWNILRYVLRNLQIIEVNSRSAATTPVIAWDRKKAFVLIGGQAMDRGFTVNGLSVTYMPRDPGGRLADTIQQRARFFGYKESYFSQCRVYLESEIRTVFNNYVDHELHMLKDLREIQAGRSTLKEWKRAFFLDPSMRATRATVTSLPTVSIETGERWIYDSRVPDGDELYEQLMSVEDVLLRDADRQADEYNHEIFHVSVKDLASAVDLWSEIDMTPLSEVRALSLQLARLTDDDPTQIVRVMRMRPSKGTSLRSPRGGSLQPFQGKSAGYPGDRNLFSPDILTVQLHDITVKPADEKVEARRTLLRAYRVPIDLSGGWLIEEDS